MSTLLRFYKYKKKKYLYCFQCKKLSLSQIAPHQYIETVDASGINVGLARFYPGNFFFFFWSVTKEACPYVDSVRIAAYTGATGKAQKNRPEDLFSSTQHTQSE